MRKNQKGIVHIALVLIIIGLIGVVGFFMYKNNQPQPSTVQTSGSIETESPFEPFTYSLLDGWNASERKNADVVVETTISNSEYKIIVHQERGLGFSPCIYPGDNQYGSSGPGSLYRLEFLEFVELETPFGNVRRSKDVGRNSDGVITEYICTDVLGEPSFSEGSLFGYITYQYPENNEANTTQKMLEEMDRILLTFKSKKQN